MVNGGNSSIPTGHINLGLNGITYYSNAWPFVDITKCGNAWDITSTAIINGFPANTPFVSGPYQGTTTNQWQGGTTTYQPSAIGVFLDVNGDMLSTQPAGTISASRILADPGSGTIEYGMPPDYASTPITLTFNNNAGGYIVTLSTTAGTVCTGTTSPLTGTLPASATSVTLTISGSGNNPPQQIVIQKTSSYNAGLIAAGQYIDPYYASTTAAGAWCIRMMPWNGPSYSNQVTYNASTYTQLANGSWGQQMVNNAFGVPLAVQVSAAKQMNKHLWAMLPQGTFSKIATVAGIANTNPAVVQLTGPCPFSNGDTIYFNDVSPYGGPLQANPSSYASSTFTGTGVAALANNTPVVFGSTINSSAPDGQNYPTGLQAGATFTGNSTGTTNLTVTSVSSTIFAGLALGGPGVPGGLTIVSQTSGPAGGAGVYVTSGATTLSNASVYTTGKTYWTVNANQGAGTWQISATPGGSALSLTGSAPATINVMVNNNAIGIYGQIVNPTYATGTWTLNGHGLPNGTAVQFGIAVAVPLQLNNVDTSTYPTGMSKQTQYYIVNATTNTFQISATIGGSALSLTGSLSGTANMCIYLQGVPVTVSNVSGNTFQMNGLSTAGFVGSCFQNISGNVGGYNTGTFVPFVFKAFNLTDTLANVGSIASYSLANMPSNLQTLYEPPNEWWNGAYNSREQVSTLAKYQPQLSSAGLMGFNPYAIGYIQCAMAYAVYQAYGSANRSKYRFVMGCNWTGFDVLGGPAGVIAGAQQFLTDNSISLTLPQLFDHLSMTTYTGLSYTVNGDTPTTVTFGTNTIAIPAGLQKPGGGAITDASVAGISDPNLGLPIKLNTNSPGGTLPSALSAGILGGSTYPSGSGTIYWIVGTGPNYGLAASPGGSPIAFSGGSGSNNAVVCSMDVIQYLMAQSQSLHTSNPTTYPNQWTYYGNEIGNDTIDSRWTGGFWSNSFPTAFSVAWTVKVANYYINNYLASGKPLSGCTLIGYEGGNNNNPLVGGFPLIADATWQAAYTFEQYSSGQAAVLLATYNQLVASSLMFKMSQFQDIGDFGIYAGSGDYAARLFVGDNNPRWAEVVAINAM